MLNFYAPINNLGYGIHSYNLLKSLDDNGAEICLFPVNHSVQYSNIHIDKWLKNSKCFNSKDTSIMIYHENFMNRFCGKCRIGFPVFETGIRESEIPLLKSLDYIFQPSHWGKKYLEERGFNNVHVVPEGYNPEQFNMGMYDYKSKIALLDKYGIIFTHIGKFEERKSSLDIIKVFTQALDGHKIGCKLVAHMLNMFKPNWINTVEEHLIGLGYNIAAKDDISIKYVKNNLTVLVLKTCVKNVSELYTQGHFGLYASKAEGWNLPLIESLACGMPCVTTNCSGQGEYLKGYPKELLISSEEEEVAKDNVWFFGDRGSWRKPNLSSLKQILVNIVNDPVKYLNLSKQCNDCVKDFTWDNSAKVCLSILKDINCLT